MTHFFRSKTVLFLIVGAVMPAWTQEALKIEVSAGGTARTGTVLRCDLPPAFLDAESLALYPAGGDTPVPVQREMTSDGPGIVWLLESPLAANERREYVLRAAEGQPESDAPRVNVVTDRGAMRVNLGERLVLAYRFAMTPSPIPDAPYYRRSGYIHPLFAPSGQLITDDFNPDHAHQHGIMMAWRKVRFDGRENNGWDQQARTGRVEHGGIDTITSGPVYGGLTTRLKHVDLTAPEGPVAMLDERWTVRVYAFDDHFLFDIESVQTCATEKPVLLEEVHYGGMTIRGNAAWAADESYDFLTSEGKTKADGNHTRPNWVVLHGPLEGGPAGVAILDHPDNFRFPQPVRLHPTMPYFCFAPTVTGEFSIKPGEAFVSRYRYLVFDGTVDSDAVEQAWQDYANPPQVRIKES